MICNDLSTKHAKYCGTNCHVVGKVHNSTNTIKNSQVNKKKDDPSFGWANKEVELLLESIKIFKVNMEAEGVNSESLRTKYDKIMEIVQDNSPKTGDIEEFP